jgi:drug/metabolite transporter (DMT)-like permease
VQKFLIFKLSNLLTHVTLLAVTFNLFLVLLVQAVLWGSAFAGIKIGLESLDAGHLTLLRHVVASLCFVPFLLFTKSRLFPNWRDVPFFFFIGFLGYSVYHTALNFGELNVSAGTASLIIATAPAFTAIVAYFLLGDKLPVLGWAGILLSFAGVVLIVLGDTPELGFNVYALLILLSAVVTAFYATLQRPLFKTYTAAEVTAFATWAGTVPMLIFLPGFFEDLRGSSLNSLLAGVYIGIFPSAIAYTLFAYAISKLPVTSVASFLYTVPIFGLLFSWLLLGEVPTWLTVVGGLIAIAGIVVVNRSRQQQQLKIEG